jgi:glycosyltransferase involved in cell wall biosynthesis
VLLTLARLPGFDRYKGVDEVLECLPEIVAADPNIIYVIAGEGEDRRRLEGKAAALGMKDYVIFTGFVDEKDKPYYYQLADVFVMPGRGEGFGFVFLEALACGVPVIGSILDGSREALIDGQLGDLVDPRDLEQVKSATLRALTKPKVIPHGLEYFSWPSFRERIAAAVESLRNK